MCGCERVYGFSAGVGTFLEGLCAAGGVGPGPSRRLREAGAPVSKRDDLQGLVSVEEDFELVPAGWVMSRRLD